MGQYVVSQKSLCFYEHVTLQRKSHNIEVSFHDQNVEPVVMDATELEIEPETKRVVIKESWGGCLRILETANFKLEHSNSLKLYQE